MAIPAPRAILGRVFGCPVVVLAIVFVTGCAGKQRFAARPQVAGPSEHLLPFPAAYAPAPYSATPYHAIPYNAPSRTGNEPAPAGHPASGASKAVAYALARLGARYCWGGAGPACFDCSGLTRAAWQAGGRSIPRTSEQQAESLAPVALGRILPGDIAWRPGHVGIYVGRGLVVSATKTGDVVRAQPLSGYDRAFRP